MTRYVIVLPLTAMAVGDSFPVRSWPLHVTIVPSFESEATPSDLEKILAEFASTAPPFDATVGESELFGLSRTVPVNLVDPTPQLLSAHRELLDLLSTRLAIEVDSPHFAGAGYRPHVTAIKTDRARDGDTLHLTQLAVVDMRPDGPEGGRAVVAAVTLRGTAPAHQG